MAVDKQNELPKATQREAKLRTQLDGLQSQVTELHRAREENMENPELSSEVQSLKEKLDEHSKQLEQSVENLNQLESENLFRRDEKRRFQTQIRSMPTLETPNSRGDTTRPPMTLNGDGATHENGKGTQTYDVEDSESEPEPDKEISEGGTATRSSMTTYLEQMFSKRFDAMQSMVERLPG
ncbi:hypothetical protein F2Q69_00006520 [Brassica cretica]|uniref:Uncharacterized protein n=1 Tax=Brassica cretica TaxID=69181 RepID=A0A8S9P535_BRACR|nr:hypothetical protein F2Q69_00006520 [Brassica cretica]